MRSNEEIQVLLILSVVEECLNERSYKGHLLTTKLHKIIYDVAEDLNLDITRSWYLRGKYIWAGQDIITYFSNYNSLGELGDVIDNGLFKSVLGHTEDVVKKAAHAALNRFNVLYSNLNEYLSIMYKKDAPKEYKLLYSSHLSLKEIFDEIKGNIDGYLNRNSLLFYIKDSFGDITLPVSQFSKTVFEYHKELSKIGDLANPVIEYTTLMDELILGAEEKLRMENFKEEHFNFLSEVLEYYDTVVWKLPSTYIAQKTIKGPRKEELLEKFENQLNHLIEKIEAKIYDLEDKAYEIDLFPSEDYIAKRISDSKIAKEYQKLIQEYFV